MRTARIAFDVDDLAVDGVNQGGASDRTIRTDARRDLGVLDSKLLGLRHDGPEIHTGAGQAGQRHASAAAYGQSEKITSGDIHGNPSSLSVAAEVARSVEHCTEVVKGHVSATLEPHVLVRDREGVAADQPEARVLHSRAPAAHQADLNDRTTIAIIYSLPTIAIFYALRRYITAGLARGAAKSRCPRSTAALRLAAWDQRGDGARREFGSLPRARCR